MATFEKELLKVGSYKDGTVNITLDDLNHFAETFVSKMGGKINVCATHEGAADPSKTYGWCTDMSVVGTSLMGKLDIGRGEEDVQINDVSVGGNMDCLSHIAVCPNPAVRTLRAAKKIAASDETPVEFWLSASLAGAPIIPVETPEPEPKEIKMSMDFTNLSALCGAVLTEENFETEITRVITELKARCEAFGLTMAPKADTFGLSLDRKTVAPELAEARGQVITMKLEKLEAAGKLTPAQKTLLTSSDRIALSLSTGAKDIEGILDILELSLSTKKFGEQTSVQQLGDPIKDEAPYRSAGDIAKEARAKRGIKD